MINGWKIALGVSLILFFSCQENIEFEQSQYIKVLGLEGSAIAEKIIELDNGDLMILGQMGVAAHDVESGPAGPILGETELASPFIAITDGNGNVKSLRSYPIDQIDTGDTLRLLNTENKTTFHNIVENPQGGYTVLARMLAFDAHITIPNVVDTTVYSEPGRNFYNPLLLSLDADLNIRSIHSLNGGSGWDLFYRRRAEMKELSNNEIGVLLTQKNFLFDDASRGYSFLRLNHELETIELAEDFDHPGGKFAYNFDIDGDDNVIILGSKDFNTIDLFRLPLNDMISENEQEIQIDDDGTLGNGNFNEHFVLSTSSEQYAVLYTNNREASIILKFYDLNLNRVGFEVVLESPQENDDLTLRAPRAFCELENGDFLAYILRIPSTNESLSGELHRIGSNGESIFSVSLDGTPGDVIEGRDGSILAVANVEYNSLLHKINIYKLNENGELY